MTRRHPIPSLAPAAAVVALFAAAGAGPAAAAGEPPAAAPPALVAFQKAWAGVTDYRATVTADERSNDGNQHKHYVYDFRFLKPDLARIDVIEGAGRGSGAVWHGGDTILGHTGGFLSALKVSVPLADGRAKSLRGGTIATSSFGANLTRMLDTPGKLSEAPAGGDTTDVTLVPRDPIDGGVTRVVLSLSNATHLPVALTEDVNGTPVDVQRYDDVKTNVGLTPADFN